MDEPLPGGMPPYICVFDTETDGVDLEDTRIITTFIGVMDTATMQVIERHSWVLEPERDIPQVAADVHGYSTERARIEGQDRVGGIASIVDVLLELAQRMPVVAMNAIYDFTILDREARRVGLVDMFNSPFELCARDPEGRVVWPIVFDPMVFDRAIDKFRKGSRRLVDLARVYGVKVEENAHDAEADCRMAGGVAIKLLGHSRLQGLSMRQVHAKLILTQRSNNLGLADYWAKTLSSLDAESRAQRVEAIADVRAKAGLWPCVPRV